MSSTYSFLIIDTYYPGFLSSLYNNIPELAEKNYIAQRDIIMDQCFGTADYYSVNLKKLGCEAEEIIPNNEVLQMRWATEAGFNTNRSLLKKLASKLPKIKNVFPELQDSLKVLREQIIVSKPDVLYMQDLSFCPPSFLSEVKQHVKLLVGQIACPLPPPDYLRPYDLILTSFPHYVDRFRETGIKSEYFKIAFDPSVLDRTGPAVRKYSCTFVGGISPAHRRGTELLEKLGGSVDIDFFGYGADTLAETSPILPRHHGEAWGLDMYRILASSKITINRHIDAAENNANNMRLYEATGCGALLITDYKDNLNDLFETGREVVAYKNLDELVDLIKFYSIHEHDRQDIADAGQRRTLNEHTYFIRMKELIEIISRHL